jgi:hypothetical protein
MKTALTGIVHGKSIQLNQEPGLPDGQFVNVTLEPACSAESPRTPAALEALRRAAGSRCDDMEGLDRYLEWNRRQRKSVRREIPE